MSWRGLSAKTQRKSWDNTKAHFTNAGNARADAFYEWFRRTSRSGIESQWEIVLRSQSTSAEFHSSTFFAALNSAVIDTVMGHVNVHIDCHLMNCDASLCVSSGEPALGADVCQGASRMRRNYGDAAAHHNAQNTQQHTRTYQHQQQAH